MGSQPRLTPNRNRASRETTTGGMACITRVSGERMLSMRPPRYQAAKMPTMEPMEKLKMVEVPTRNRVQPMARPSTSATGWG